MVCCTAASIQIILVFPVHWNFETNILFCFLPSSSVEGCCGVFRVFRVSESLQSSRAKLRSVPLFLLELSKKLHEVTVSGEDPRHEIGTLVCKDHNWQAVLRIFAKQNIGHSLGTVKLREGSFTALGATVLAPRVRSQYAEDQPNQPCHDAINAVLVCTHFSNFLLEHKIFAKNN